jgi:hypothetical protein
MNPTAPETQQPTITIQPQEVPTTAIQSFIPPTLTPTTTMTGPFNTTQILLLGVGLYLLTGGKF